MRFCSPCDLPVPGKTCHACGGPTTAFDAARLEREVDARLRTRLAAWRAEGLVDAETTEQLLASLSAESSATSPDSTDGLAKGIERFADGVSEAVGGLVEWRPPPPLSAAPRF